MFDNGVVDIHNETNISGMVYGPSFIEIENKHDERMYFNGVIVGGAGIYIEGKSADGAPMVFVFDKRATDSLATYDDRGKAPIIDSYVIEK